MKFKEILITTFFTLIVLGLFACNYVANKFILKAESIYEVFLNGSVIGYIENDQELYDLINEKQSEIKKTYKVENVYPPENFNIIKTNSYNVQISSVEDIYNKMAKIDSFTIEGYQIKVTPPEDTGEKPFYIYSLNKEIFDKAINNFILAFVDEEKYQNYINESQPKIDGTGSIIELMNFVEDITLKKSFINVDEKIFTKESDLSQYLLFGENNDINYYTVKEGDTITTISEDNKLNVVEFLVANPQYTTDDSLLKIGDVVNISLINPVLSFAYEVNEVSDVDVPFEKKVEYDKSKPVTYSAVTTPGVNGVTRMNIVYRVVNGEPQQGVAVISSEELVAKVDEVTVKGSQSVSTGGGTYIDTGDVWAWPTNSPYVITSRFAWRWGTLHEGLDISGTGYGSPIYAALDGTVYNAAYGGKLYTSSGWNVIIDHENGYSTVYGHMVPYSLRVKEGDHVTRGQIIGLMGTSGYSTGTHLHFGLYKGIPYRGGVPINPCSLYQGRC